jgi:hypothetical protein
LTIKKAVPIIALALSRRGVHLENRISHEKAKTQDSFESDVAVCKTLKNG